MEVFPMEMTRAEFREARKPLKPRRDATGHRQVTILLKCGKTKVDKGIAPLVAWMDSFKSVQTLASCQGFHPESPKAYVFFESHRNDLVTMLKLLKAWYYDTEVVVTVGYNPVIPSRPPALKYNLEFPNRGRFNKIMARLNAGERL